MILDLRRRYGAEFSKLCILTSLGPWSSFQGIKDLNTFSVEQQISISWPLVAIQYWCDTSGNVIWCHDFMILDLRRRYIAEFSKLCILTSLGPWSSFQSMKDLSICSTYGSIYSMPCPLVTIQCRCYTWCDVIMSWFWIYCAVMAPNAQIFISWLPEVRTSCSKACKI